RYPFLQTVDQRNRTAILIRPSRILGRRVAGMARRTARLFGSMVFLVSGWQDVGPGHRSVLESRTGYPRTGSTSSAKARRFQIEPAQGFDLIRASFRVRRSIAPFEGTSSPLAQIR